MLYIYFKKLICHNTTCISYIFWKNMLDFQPHTQDTKQLLSPIFFLFLALILILERYLHANFYCIANPNIFILDAFITPGYLWYSKKRWGMMYIHFFSSITLFVYLEINLLQASNRGLPCQIESRIKQFPGFCFDRNSRFFCRPLHKIFSVKKRYLCRWETDNYISKSCQVGWLKSQP